MLKLKDLFKTIIENDESYKSTHAKNINDKEISALMRVFDKDTKETGADEDYIDDLDVVEDD